MDDRGKLFKIDREQTAWLKGIAIALVLLGHADWIRWGGAGGVALFLIVSGYGIRESYRQSGLSFFWCKRFRAVWLPYFLVAIFNVAIYFPCSKGQFAATILGLDFGRNLDATMWYISFIFFWYLAFYITAAALRLVRRKWISTAAELLLIFAAAMLCRELAIKGVWNAATGAVRYVWAFPIGLCLSMLSEIKIKRPALVWTMCFALTTTYMFRRYMSYYDGLYAAGMALQAISLIKIISLPTRAKACLSFLGKYAYSIYLFEGTMLFRRAYWFGVLENKLLIDLTYMLASIGMGYIFWKYLYKKAADQIKFEKIIKF